MSTACSISIVISTLNRANLLGAAIDSICAQNAGGTSYELIIVDNNSTDDTAEVVRRYMQRYAAVRYAFQPEPGVSQGRNLGVQLARAPIVAFTDDDVRVPPSWVSRIQEAFDRHRDAAFVGGPVLPLWAAAPPAWLTERHWGPVSLLNYGDALLTIEASRPLCLITANLAVRRRVFEEVGPFAPEFRRCQDHELLLRFWAAGQRGLYLPDLVVHTEVPQERLTKAYHRMWHERNGRYYALMPISDLFRTRNSAPPRTLWGTPLFVYRQIGAAAVGWLTATLGMNQSIAFYHETCMRRSAGYIRARYAQRVRKRTPPLHEERPHLADAVSPGDRTAEASIPPGMSSNRSVAQPMRRGRVLLVYAMLAVLLTGSARDILSDEEHWPFSPYPMFSAVERSRTLRSLRLFAVTPGAETRELPLLAYEHLQPMDQCRVSTALSWMRRRPDGEQRMKDAARSAFERYEALRHAGKHDGPAIAAVRVYLLQWDLTRWADNVDRPKRRELVAEYRKPAEE